MAPIRDLSYVVQNCEDGRQLDYDTHVESRLALTVCIDVGRFEGLSDTPTEGLSVNICLPNP